MSRFKTAGMLAAIPAFFFLAYQFWPMPVAAAEACGQPAKSVPVLWKPDRFSELEGERVTVEAVVTGDFTDEDGFGGFYAQMPDDLKPDADSHRGIFVYAPEKSVTAGQRLRFSGQVSQFRGMNQLSRIQLKDVCAEDEHVKPRPLSLPLSEPEREARQGMLVQLESPVVVTGTWPLVRYGVVKLADERLYRPTQIKQPGEEARAQARDNAKRMLRLDDASRRQFPEPIPWPSGGLSPENRMRVGDQVHDVVGVLEHRYDEWRLQPVAEPRFERVNQRPDPLPKPSDTEVRVASFNVENYFIGDGEGGGFPTERGAAAPEAFARQEAKLLSAIDGLNAHILGLIEIENNGFGERSAIDRLARKAEGNWQVVKPAEERLGSDAIMVGLIYDADHVEAVGAATSLEAEPFRWGNRRPLAQSFRHRAGGETFRVVVNHFKSKICGNAEGANAAQGDGQGCWNALRSEASEALLAWVDELAAESGNDRTLLVGDFNAYAREQPIAALEAAGFRNMAEELSETARPVHSYVFQGESGTLDYVFASEAMQSDIVEAGIWPINADEPPAFEYDGQHRSSRVNQNLYTPGPWRSSDHDPGWITIDVAPTR